MKHLSKWAFFIVLSLIGPLNSFASSNPGDVIYGEDGRVHIGKMTNKTLRNMGRSTFAMIKSRQIETLYDGLLVKITGKLLKDSNFKVCDGEKPERFSRDLTLANCSGFLVASDLMVTAGHCFRNPSFCQSYKWVLDFRKDLVGEKDYYYTGPENVYSCKEIVSKELDYQTKNDFALIRLDRPVVGRAPLSFRKEGKIDKDAKVIVVGHPSGLPSIVTEGGKIRKNDNPWFFRASLDTFSGNSGSAVINRKTGLVEGILVRGARDYKYDVNHQCYRPALCGEDECRGEDVTRITVIPELVPGMTPKKPDPRDPVDPNNPFPPVN